MEARRATEAEEESLGHWKMDVSKGQQREMKKQAAVRDINQARYGKLPSV